MELKFWRKIYEMNNNTSEKEIADLIRSIQNGTNTLNDEEVIIKVGRYIPSYNCEWAAHGFFEISSTICPIRPNLTHDLFIITLRPLYYIGIEESSLVQTWVKGLLESRAHSFNKEQMEWIQNRIKDENFIQQAFTAVKWLEEQF